MNNIILEEAQYVLSSGKTLREAASYLNVSKSSLHRHLNENLKKIDYELYLKVKKLFLEHNKNRHINGGNATRLKYLAKDDYI